MSQFVDRFFSMKCEMIRRRRQNDYCLNNRTLPSIVLDIDLSQYHKCATVEPILMSENYIFIFALKPFHKVSVRDPVWHYLFIFFFYYFLVTLSFDALARWARCFHAREMMCTFIKFTFKRYTNLWGYSEDRKKESESVQLKQTNGKYNGKTHQWQNPPKY